MSQTASAVAGSLFSRCTCVFLAPVDRSDNTPTPFDPSEMGRFSLSNPPAGWLKAGNIIGFERIAQASVLPIRSGSPATVKLQSRTALEEEVRWTFTSWNRMAMLLSGGVQTMNLLQTAPGSAPNASGGSASPAEAVLAGSSPSLFQVAASTAIKAGDMVVVDEDYTGSSGYIGSGAAADYVTTTSSTPDVDYTRRMSLNVSLVSSVADGTVTLASPLLAGTPTGSMKAAVVKGFTDRTSGAFFSEWSALIVVEGLQGDRMLFHYPRLEATGSQPAEVSGPLAGEITRWRPSVHLRALPVIDATDGAAAICYRTYLPAPMRLV